MINIYYKNKKYNVCDGAVLQRNLSQELDTFSLIVQGVSKSDFMAMEYVDIDDTSNTLLNQKKRMCISSVKKDVISFKPKLYSASMQLISSTILLQRVVLPNLKITQYEDVSKSILSQINRGLLYFKRQRHEDIVISSSLLAKIEGKATAEYSFARPTLFEYLNELLRQVNCCVKLDYDFTNDKWVLDYLDLDVNITNSNESTLQYSVVDVTEEFASEKANEIEVEIENALVSKSTSADNDIRVFRTSPRPESYAQMKDVDSAIYLPEPIYSIEKIVMGWVTYGGVNKNYMTEKDITSYVIEKKQWEMLSTTISDDAEKRFAKLYYEEGNNYIKNLGDDTQDIAVFMRSPFIVITNHAMLEGANEVKDKEPRLTYFKIWYRTKSSAKFSQSKNETNNGGILIDNQSESYVDSHAFGKAEKQKIEMLGNEELTINCRYPKNATINKLGSRINLNNSWYYLTNISVQTTKNFNIATETYTKNYSAENLFTALKMKKRYTKIDDGTDSLVRHDLLKIYCSFGFSNALHNIDFSIMWNTSNHYEINDPTSFCNYLMRGINNDYAEYSNTYFPKNVIVNTTFEDDSTSSDILLPLNRYLVGNSVILNFNMMDNFSAGKKIYRKHENANDYSVDDVPYVDSNGEFKSISINIYNNIYDPVESVIFSNNINNDSYNNTTYPTAYVESSLFSDYDTYLNAYDSYLSKVPEYTYKEESASQLFMTFANVDLYKDNKEITEISIQYEFVSDDENIIVTPRFVEYTPLIFKADNNISFGAKRVFVGSHYYSRNDTKVIGNVANESIVSYSIINNRIHFIFADGFLDTLKANKQSLAIVDSNNELLIGINVTDEFNGEVYLTLKSQR